MLEDKVETLEALRDDRDRWRALALETIGNLSSALEAVAAVRRQATNHLSVVRAESSHSDDD